MSAPAARVAKPLHAPLALAAMVGSAACWGLGTVASKGALASLPPQALLAVQLAASVAALLAACAVLGLRPRTDRTGRRAAATGLLEPALAYGLGIPGLALTTAASASVIGAAEPAVVVLLAWALLREPPGRALMLAVAAAAVGVALVALAGPAGHGAAGGGAAGRLLGDLLVLGGTAAAALYVVLSSRFLADVAPLPLAASQQAVGLAAVLVGWGGGWAVGLAAPWPGEASLGAVLLAAGSGLVQYAVAFWLYLVGLRALGPGPAALALALVPVFGVAGAALALGEPVSAAQLVGAILVVAALLGAARAAAGRR